MEVLWICLLILVPTSTYASAFDVKSLSSEGWFQAEVKNGFQDIKVYKNADGNKILKLNPMSLGNNSDSYRFELLLIDVVPEFYSFGEISDLSEFAHPMANEFCLKCHLSSKYNLLFTDRYLRKWSLKEERFEFERINRKLRIASPK